MSDSPTVGISGRDSDDDELHKVLVLARGTRGDSEPLFSVVARLVERGISVTMVSTMPTDELLLAVDDTIRQMDKDSMLKHRNRFFTEGETKLPAAASRTAHSSNSGAATLSTSTLNYVCHPQFGSALRVFFLPSHHHSNDEADVKATSAWAAAAADGGNTMKSFMKLIDPSKTEENAHTMAAIVQEFMPDLIVDSGMGSQTLGQLYCIPGLCIAPTPPSYPSFHQPFIGHTTPYRWGILNYLSWFYFLWDIGQSGMANAKKARKQLNLPGGLMNMDISERQYYATLSPTLFPKPDDWPKRATYFAGRTVLFNSEHLGDFEPSKELLTFLQIDHPLAVNTQTSKIPVVYLGLGSMPFVHHETVVSQVAKDLLEAARQRKVRVLLSGKGMTVVYKHMRKQAEESADPIAGQNIIKEWVQEIGICPHPWLFSRVDGVIHHGGVGTTSSALASGTPSAIFPIGYDQPFWAYRLHHIFYEELAAKTTDGQLSIPPFEVTWAVRARFDDFMRTFNFLLKEEHRTAFHAIGARMREESNCIENVVDSIHQLYDARKNVIARKLGITPRWRPASAVAGCEKCGGLFGYFRWRYQCVACGQFICYACRHTQLQHIATFGLRYPCTACSQVFKHHAELLKERENTKSNLAQTERSTKDEAEPEVSHSQQQEESKTHRKRTA